MSAVTIAKRYGRAALELAEEEEAVDLLAADVAVIKSAMKGIPELVRGLSDVRVSSKKREAAALNICDSLALSKTTTNLLRLLVTRGRIQILSEILEDIDQRIAAYRKHARADVVVADLAFSDEIKMRLETELALMLNMKVECTITEDKSLLGGFMVSIGDERFDASVANKFERMKAQLLRGV